MGPVECAGVVFGIQPASVKSLIGVYVLSAALPTRDPAVGSVSPNGSHAGTEEEPGYRSRHAAAGGAAV